MKLVSDERPMVRFECEISFIKGTPHKNRAAPSQTEMVEIKVVRHGTVQLIKRPLSMQFHPVEIVR